MIEPASLFQLIIKLVVAGVLLLWGLELVFGGVLIYHALIGPDGPEPTRQVDATQSPVDGSPAEAD